MLPEVDLPAAVGNTEGQGEALLRKAAFEEAMGCSRDLCEDTREPDLPSARFMLSHKLPAVLLETQEKIAVNVESWIQSLSRRTGA